MDYEKLHNETLRNLQEMVSKGKITEEVAKGICADFVADSEDERIRKEMIEILKEEAKCFPLSVIAKKSNSWIAWLEKQGEQKQPKELTNSEFVEKCKGLSRLEQHILALVPTRPIDAIKVDARTIRYLVEQEQGEQKPVETIPLTWKDIKKIYHLVNEASDDLGVRAMYVNIYQEALKRFKAQKGE